MKKKIAIIVDHPVRDLGGCILLGHALKKLDSYISVYLIPMAQQEYEVFSLRPDFVVLNYIRNNNLNFIRKLIHANIQYGLMDTEGGFYGNLGDYESLLPSAPDVYENLKGNFLWGEKMLEVWSKYNLKCPNSITGLPRFDMYSDKFVGFENYFLPKEYVSMPNLIMLNTKVAVANPKFVSIEDEIKLYRTLGVKEEVIQRHLRLGRESMEGNVQLLKDLDESVSNVNIILRPHPHENQKTYENLFEVKYIKNSKVVQNGNIAPWIAKAKAVVHRHCTTAIEAVIAGKPAISTTWIPTSANAPDAEDVSFKCNNLKDFEEVIKDIINNPESSKKYLPSAELKSRVIDRWLFKVDGLSHMRVGQAILENMDFKKKANEKKCRDLLYSSFSSRAGFKAQSYNLVWKAGKAGFGRQTLWRLEEKRAIKWLGTGKGLSVEESNLWLKSFRIDHSIIRSTADDNIDQYPGHAIKMV